VIPALEELRGCGFLSSLDLHFAHALERLSGERRPEVLLAAALVSRQVAERHVCLDLDRPPSLVDEEGRPLVDRAWPDAPVWLARLRSSDLVDQGAASPAREPRPLVLDGRHRLYLRRYWDHQRQLASEVLHRAREARSDVDLAVLQEGLGRLFDSPAGRAPDWQRVAALTAVVRSFCVISGGPGTGKTFTVAKILALIAEQALAARGALPRVALLAPTGKAARRLSEALRRAAPGLRTSAAARQAIPLTASTIHRELGMAAGVTVRSRRDEDHPLDADVVVVDEASMVDLVLMSRLVRAVPPRARLVLLGDKDQLASVEAGAVLGDICDGVGTYSYSVPWSEQVRRLSGDSLPVLPTAPRESGLRDSIVELTHSHRYEGESGIGRVARAINAGRSDQALDAIVESETGVSLVEPAPDQEIVPRVGAWIARRLGGCLREPDAAGRLTALERFRVLCAHRRGRFGVEALNGLVERSLIEEGVLPEGGVSGRLVLVTRNDHALRLYNGDVGLMTERDGATLAFFLGEDGTARWLSPSRLPAHEMAFAMTVHKSQGSEFDDVVVLLPEAASPVLTRELLYTAVTRARRSVVLHGSREVFRQAVERRSERASGLRDLLWEGAAS
jgi:exodeoxyribonuclease V alpha subunit